MNIARTLILAPLLLLPQFGYSVDRLELTVGDVRGAGWFAQNVTVVLELPGSGQSVTRLHVSRLALAAAPGDMTDVRVTCSNPIVKEPLFRCARASVSGALGPLGRQSFTANLEYRSDRKSLTFDITGLKLAGSPARVSGRWLEQGWRIEAETSAASIDGLRLLAAAWVAVPKDISLDGSAAIRLVAQGAAELQSLDVLAKFAQLTASNAASTVATDKLALQIEASIKPAGQDWDIQASLRSASGQAYVDPIFLDLAVFPLNAQLQGRWLSDSSRFAIRQLDFDHAAVARGRASGELDFAADTLLRSLRVELQKLEFPGAYQALLQPFLLSSDLKDLVTSGSISGTLAIAAGAPSAVDLNINGVTAEDRAGKMAMRALRGRLNWQAAGTGEAAPSQLEWDSGMAYGITGGAARIDFVASGADFRILQPTVLPVLDGGLSINTLVVRALGTPEMSLRFDAELLPISMPLLCQAFGWPEFAGKIAGRIPQVSLDDKLLSLGGDIEATAFGGNIVVNGLKLQDPLGPYPRLLANATLRGLDLETLTGTFSFGSITGRLDGDVRNLELFRWSPVAFDARLYTPSGDKSRHLISQRAVQNLSSIGGGGGGVAAALQSGLLRFFENFRYSRLGLSCRLENEVCRMDGVEPAKGDSYYIVKGSGIPRIDIIGNAHNVNWSRLLSQIQAMQAGGSPVVK